MRTPTYRPTWRVLTVALLLLALAWVAGDAWFRGRQSDLLRTQSLVELAPYGSALAAVVNTRVALLASVRAYAESELASGGEESLLGEFGTFAASLTRDTPGIRAVQLVEDGQILITTSADGSSGLRGYDLLGDPRPVIGDDVRRGMETDRPTITGPIELLQGGMGIIARQRITDPSGKPWGLAALVLDLPPILREAGLGRLDSTGAAVALRSGTVGVFFGDSSLFTGSTPTLAVPLPDGEWVMALRSAESRFTGQARIRLLLGAGWAAILLLGGGVVLMAVGRQRALAFSVEDRTRALTRTLDSLREQGEQLRMALRAAKMGIWEWRAETDTLHWSEEASDIFGLPRDSCLSREDFYRMLTPTDRGTIRNVGRDLITGDAPEGREYRIRRPDGESRWLFTTGELYRKEDGSPERLLGIVADVTARHELELQFQHAQRMEGLGRLAGGIAHDFNNLLTAIIGYANLAASELPQGSAVRTDLASILDAAGRAADLTRQLLAFARRQPVEPKLVDLTEKISSMDRLLRRVLEAGVDLLIDIPGGPLAVMIDPAQLEQVIMNLSVNARDAMPGGGRLTLRAFPDPARDVVVLEVEDTGTGMDETTQALIFEPFFTTKAPGEGTGLGLPMCYGVIRQAGGTITVKSQPGHGTTFRIELPVAVSDPRRPETRLAETDGRAGRGRGEQILVVEDEDAVRALVQRALVKEGYLVVNSAGGDDAVATFERLRDRVDLLVSDVVLPGPSGPDLVARFRQARPDLRVLFVTGYSSVAKLPPEDAITRILRKPFTPSVLVDVVGEMIGTAESGASSGEVAPPNPRSGPDAAVSP